jgi:hypothetical protein
LFWQKRAFPELRCAAPNSRVLAKAKTREFEARPLRKKKDVQMDIFFLGGEGEIRTRGTIADTTVFKTVPLNHSGTSPDNRLLC